MGLLLMVALVLGGYFGLRLLERISPRWWLAPDDKPWRTIFHVGSVLALAGLVAALVWAVINFAGKGGTNIAGTPSNDLGNPRSGPLLVSVGAIAAGVLIASLGVIGSRRGTESR